MTFIRTHYLEHEFIRAVWKVYPTLCAQTVARIQYELGIEPTQAGNVEMYTVSDFDMVMQAIPKYKLVENADGWLELA
ncbi:hypothetical protein H6F86_20785 [Phormidium sp. FACHB-592]|uniref:Uncharacterized protein n=1 Tax=Stenomitos frigidus AS-A4 TaxID=2933935 RepID=A0ABV0KGZ9_9CYAN|nr:hypothetical protein [Phormidium sp. FACHB-592]MBD2076270.1 hypothetical protein [Phormidium sp. FACHB-592]